jgi:hypothetical protein
MATEKKFTAPQGYEEGARPQIPLIPVKSQKVAAVGYDAETKTLAVTFPNGKAVYHYPGVSPEQHAAFVGAESIGKHFGAHIQGLPFKKYQPDPKPEGEAATA